MEDLLRGAELSGKTGPALVEASIRPWRAGTTNGDYDLTETTADLDDGLLEELCREVTRRRVTKAVMVAEAARHGTTIPLTQRIPEMPPSASLKPLFQRVPAVF